MAGPTCGTMAEEETCNMLCAVCVNACVLGGQAGLAIGAETQFLKTYTGCKEHRSEHSLCFEVVVNTVMQMSTVFGRFRFFARLAAHELAGGRVDGNPGAHLAACCHACRYYSALRKNLEISAACQAVDEEIELLEYRIHKHRERLAKHEQQQDQQQDQQQVQQQEEQQEPQQEGQPHHQQQQEQAVDVAASTAPEANGIADAGTTPAADATADGQHAA